MPVALRVSITGSEDVQRALRRISPSQNTEILRRSLLKGALLVQRLAATKYIHPGGQGPPLPDRVTSRTGTLRRSIRVNRSPLPFAVEVGSDVVYAPVHELGSRTHPKRPFLAPALDEASKAIGDFVADEIAKEIRRL